MKWSEFFIPTLKESPQDAEIKSHKLMIRAGLIFKLSSGLYTYLPLGLMVIRNIEKIIREEMSRKGAIELLMPILQPREIWLKSGRYEIMSSLMLKSLDRENREFILGPTHEEIITDLVAHKISSYKVLPKNFYQIQSKFRDEIRPRFGVIRAREFIMKDGYSFALTLEESRKIYDDMYDAYDRIFKRCGLNFSAVEADTGVMGGNRSHEFTAITDAGEDIIVSCKKCGYAANLELAKRRVPDKSDKDNNDKFMELEEVHTPNMKKVSELEEFFKVGADKFIKTLIYKGSKGFYAVLIRGDIDVNEAKLRKELDDNEIALAESEDIERITGAEVGFAGPVGLKGIEIAADLSVRQMVNAITGANKKDYHYKNVNVGRDFEVNRWLDIGMAVEGDLCPNCGEKLDFSRGIEVGQIFELGTKYSAKLSAKVQNEKGEEIPLIMGCYGIGVSRTVAAVVEQNSDDKGIIWPIEIAPFKVIVIPLDKKECLEKGMEVYDKLKNNGIECIIDDRDERPGFKFSDADLIGIPIKIILGKKGLKEGVVEIKMRKNGEIKKIAFDNVIGEIKNIIERERNL